MTNNSEKLQSDNDFLTARNQALQNILSQYELGHYYNEQLYTKKTFTDTCNFLLEYITEFFQTKNEEIWSSVFFVEEDSMEFSCKIVKAPEQKTDLFADEIYAQIEEGLVAWCINNKKISFVKSLKNEQFKNCILIPLFGLNDLLGFILIYLNQDIESVTQESLQIINVSCLHAGLYIDNLISYQKLKKYSENMEALVSERTKELNEKNIKLKELNEVKSNFISSVSHELRTPLTSILGFAKVVLKYVLRIEVLIPEEKQQEKDYKFVQRIKDNLDIIINEGLRLTRLINDVLDLAKIESGKIVWRDEVTEVRKIVSDAVDIARGFFLHNDNLEFKQNIAEGDIGRINVDQDKILQVIDNLISNSKKFTDKGYVQLSVYRQEGKIHFEIEDTGDGIAAKDFAAVFEKFKQVGDTLTDKPKGTGLGLPICKEIIEHYDGQIWVESELGKGSKFKFVLPEYIP